MGSDYWGQRKKKPEGLEMGRGARRVGRAGRGMPN